jgi:hypothetical protein
MDFRFARWLRENENEDDYNDEIEWAKAILERNARLEDYVYYPDYVRTIAKEAALVSGGRVLFIGGGPVPLTPILLYQNHGIRCDAMDYDKQAVQLGTAVLHKLEEQIPGVSSIKVFFGDGTKFNSYAQYSTIMVALEAGINEQVKKAIFDNIKSQISPQTTILIRGSNSADAVDGESFTNVEGYVGSYFSVLKKVPVFSNLSTSYLLKCEVCPADSKDLKGPTPNQTPSQPFSRPSSQLASPGVPVPQ